LYIQNTNSRVLSLAGMIVVFGVAITAVMSCFKMCVGEGETHYKTLSIHVFSIDKFICQV
jgi:hypothetical protein